MISNRNYNILQLYNLFSNEFSAFDFAFRMNLLYQSFNSEIVGQSYPYIQIMIKNLDYVLNALNAKDFTQFFIRAYFIIQKYQLIVFYT